MQIPSWLIHATGAQAFANNPLNGFKPTMGDAMQGIGHSLMEHYRGNQPTPAAGALPSPGAGMNPMQILAALGGQGQQQAAPQAPPGLGPAQGDFMQHTPVIAPPVDPSIWQRPEIKLPPIQLPQALSYFR